MMVKIKHVGMGKGMGVIQPLQGYSCSLRYNNKKLSWANIQFGNRKKPEEPSLTSRRQIAPRQSRPFSGVGLALQATLFGILGVLGLDNHFQNEKSQAHIQGLTQVLAQNAQTDQAQQQKIAQLQSENQQLNAQLQHQSDAYFDLASQLNQKLSINAISQAAAKAFPSTVQIEIRDEAKNLSIGAGVIVSAPDGRLYVLTCDHVVNSLKGDEDEEKASAKPTTITVNLYRQTNQAEAVTFTTQPLVIPAAKMDEQTQKMDLAVLPIPLETRIPSTVRYIEMRDTQKEPLRYGETVLALGSPYALKDSLTVGVVSHPHRVMPSFVKIPGLFVQTDAGYNPGNSGGGLFDLQGRLVGINTFTIQGREVLGSATHVDSVKKYLELAWTTQEQLSQLLDPIPESSPPETAPPTPTEETSK